MYEIVLMGSWYNHRVEIVVKPSKPIPLNGVEKKMVRAIDRILSGRSWKPFIGENTIVEVDASQGCAVLVSFYGYYVLTMKKNNETGEYHGRVGIHIANPLVMRRMRVLHQEYGVPFPSNLTTKALRDGYIEF